MGIAEMSHDSDQTEESDDLIAELARLMAEDARGERPSTPAAVPAANDVKSGGQSAARVESATSAEVDTKLSASLSASDRLNASRGVDALYDADERPAAQPAPVNPPQTPVSNVSMASPVNAAPVEEVSAPVQNDPIADLISAQLASDDAGAFSNPAPVAPAFQDTPVSPDQDSFNTSPIFGLGGSEPTGNEIPSPTHRAATPVSQPSQASQDPLSEIESLIGEAVRAGVQPPAQQEPVAVFPNDVNIPPGTHVEVNEASIAAETAILAATVESHDATITPQYVEAPVEHAQTAETYSGGSFWRGLIGPSVAGAVLLAVGFGLYMAFGTAPSSEAGTPVLTADGSPDKMVPAPISQNSAASQSVVMNGLSGDNQANAGERIVSRDESLTNDPIARVITSEGVGPNGLVNRKVQTVTVRPDGTIISGDGARAGGEVLPVERPTVPDLPAGSPNGGVAFQPSTEVSALAQPAVTTTPVVEAPVPQERTIIAKVPAPAATSSNSEAVDLIASAAGQAIAAAQNTPIAAPATTSTKAPAYVQISSTRSEQTARASMTEIQSRYGSILSGQSLEVQRADLGERGIYYRVRVPSASITEANQLCTNIKQAGGDCFVRTD